MVYHRSTEIFCDLSACLGSRQGQEFLSDYKDLGPLNGCRLVCFRKVIETRYGEIRTESDEADKADHSL
jgi:hypothetical protein